MKEGKNRPLKSFDLVGRAFFLSFLALLPFFFFCTLPLLLSLFPLSPPCPIILSSWERSVVFSPLSVVLASDVF